MILILKIISILKIEIAGPKKIDFRLFQEIWHKVKNTVIVIHFVKLFFSENVFFAEM